MPHGSRGLPCGIALFIAGLVFYKDIGNLGNVEQVVAAACAVCIVFTAIPFSGESSVPKEILLCQWGHAEFAA